MVSIFTKIIKGEIPCYKIYEDDNYLAFLDIMPNCEGHTLLVPKKPAKWVWDVENYDEYFETARKIVRHFQKVTGDELVLMKIVGTDVPYAHIHIMPADYARKPEHRLEQAEAEKVLKKFSMVE